MWINYDPGFIADTLHSDYNHVTFHIPSLVGLNGETQNHDEKAKNLLDHFSNLIGSSDGRSMGMNWDFLQLPSSNLSHLEEDFSLEELKEAISSCHSKKAPGPAGFIGGFFKKCWDFIHGDLLLAFNQLHSLRDRQWKLLNTAHIVLLPKEGASRATDYRPVSLMHSAAKIVCKMLASRLAPELPHLISQSQSAFIKGRSIQDNFIYVQNVIRAENSKKRPLIFLKLDIAKAFDSVNWSYLLEILSAYGFGPR